MTETEQSEEPVELPDDHETGLFMWRDGDGHRAWGVAFPTGRVYLLWDLESWPPEERLLGTHVSDYANVGDVLHANGGTLEWGSWDV